MSDKLKKIVKHYVKEVLTEEFAKMDFEGLIKNKVQECLALEDRKTSRNLNESIRAASPPKRKKPKITPEALGINDSVWKSVYEDTLSSGNPILNGTEDEYEAPDPEHPEHVPENMLENLGLMRDYSKHIGLDKSEEQAAEEDDWKRRAEERQKMLRDTVKRAG